MGVTRFILLVLVLSSGCRGAPELDRADPPTEVARVHVDAAGVIYLNDEPTSMDAVKAEFIRLQGVEGGVHYSRADPERDPPPNAKEVIEAVMEARLPIRLLDAAEQRWLRP